MGMLLLLPLFIAFPEHILRDRGSATILMFLSSDHGVGF